MNVLELLAKVSENYRNEPAVRGVLSVAEEAGEFVGAFRRNVGLARRSGTREEVEDELADVVIAAWAAGTSLGIDMEAVITRKAEVVLGRIERGER